MIPTELDRLRSDLQALRKVTGADLPFEGRDIRYGFAMGCAAFLPALAGTAGVETRSGLLLSALPFVLTVIASLVHNYRAAHPSRACPHQKRKEYRRGVPLTLALVPLLFAFHWWATSAGAPRDVASGAVLQFLGLLLLSDGLYNPQRRAVVLPGMAAIAGGCLWPYLEQLQHWTLLWSCVAVSLIGASAVMRRQLLAHRPSA